MPSKTTYNIIANAGPISNYLRQIIHTFKNIIALDGAADKLFDFIITPDVVIGDFDSIKQSTLVTLKKLDVPVYHIHDQDYTDLDKAIMFCDSNGAKVINIYNCLGARLDHTLINLRMLKRYWSETREMTIFDDQSKVIYLTNQSIELTGKVGDDVAVMAFTEAVVTSTGLQYEMNNYKLEFAYQESTSNSLSANHATIKVEGDAIAIFSHNIMHTLSES
jgi:thiamine pyrophosphokinase